MKNSILFFYLCGMLITSNTFSQEYHPLPQENAIWNTVGDNMFSGNLWRFRYGVQGDTIINNQSYTKVYSLFDTTLVHPYSSYFGAIRENDSKQVYLLMPEFEETMLYDFSMDVGDTIWFNIGGGLCYDGINFLESTHYKVVTSIDSVQIENGEYRKRWQFQEIFIPDSWIEGIGSTEWFGLFNPIISLIALWGDDYSFACFKQEEEVLYLNNDHCDICFCQLLTDIQPNSTTKPDLLQIYPNPATDIFHLQIKSPDNRRILISNVLGEVIFEKDIINESEISMNITKWTKGIYVVHLINANQQLMAQEKLIIQ